MRPTAVAGEDDCRRRSRPAGGGFAAGLSPDAGGKETQRTFLQRAAAEGDAATVALCIKYGVDLDRRNASNETALGYACDWGHLPVVKLL